MVRANSLSPRVALEIMPFLQSPMRYSHSWGQSVGLAKVKALELAFLPER